MTAAAPVSISFDSRPSTGDAAVHYSWTQYQITTTVNGETSTSPLAAMTREDAVAFAKEARVCITKHVEGFTGMKLSMVACSYSESITAHADSHEDGDGSPIIRETALAGKKWARTRLHGNPRNFNMEASDARRGCKELQDYFLSVGC